jgi:hypothetical protein
MAVVQPPKHDIGVDAGSGGAPPPQSSVQASTDPQPQSPAPAPAQAQVAPSVQGPSPTWPDALSARGDHGATDHDAPVTVTAATPTPPSPPPPQSSPTVANSASRAQSDDQSVAQEGNAAASEQDRGAATGAASVAERAPWPAPVSPAAKARKHPVIGSDESTPPSRPVEPTAPPPQPAATVDNAGPAAGTATNKTRSESRKSRVVEQRQRLPGDDADQSGDDRVPATLPPPSPRQRVILPAPQQRDASMDRDHRDRGPVRLFDFFGGSDHWHDNRWGNGNGDDHWGWHDDDRD